MSGSAFFDLPFVRAPLGEAANLWVTSPSGTWQQDNTTGKAYADALIGYMEDERDPAALTRVTRAIVLAGAWTGIEVGFFHRFAEVAVTGR